MAWQLDMTDEVRDWLHRLRKEDHSTLDLITDSLRVLLAGGDKASGIVGTPRTSQSRRAATPGG